VEVPAGRGLHIGRWDAGVDEASEDVADGGLARLVAVEAGTIPSRNHAAHAGHLGVAPLITWQVDVPMMADELARLEACAAGAVTWASTCRPRPRSPSGSPVQAAARG